ncbi:MAG TPA: hypothetical protein DCR97_03335 [Deltaproteobacteria bacterium]|nr:hypothetical protein [Deltaproteobacteria bacterium]
MRVLVITPYYAPDLGPSAPLFTMLSEGLTQRGHTVTVIAAVPHYPSGQVSTAFRGGRIRRSSENGVDVVRVPLPSLDRAKLAKRFFQFICYQLGATWVGLTQQYDVALVANPALWVWLPFAFHVVLRRKPAIFSIHDLYPDVGVTLGIFRHRPVIAAVSGMERFCLNHSFPVRILSDSFRPGLRTLGVPDTKMALVYDWVDTDLVHPISHDNVFAQEHHLVDKFVVLYAGNLGLSQGLEHVLTAAEQIAGQKDLRFVFVGDGAGRERLMAEAEHRHLSNVLFLPFQPRDRLPEVLATADVSLAILRRGIGTGSLPSKIFSAMASGRPLIVSLDEGSETWNLVKRADAGLCVPPEDPSQLASAVLDLQQNKDLRERLGRNGRTWAEEHHSSHSAAKQFENLLSRALSHKKSCS